jgi:alkylation response protein AidB-like acyl-CoA dehydrogenase
MMTPYINDARKLFQESIHRFMRIECPREYVRQCDEEKKFPAELVAKMADLGWFSLTLPEEYDGFGDHMDMVVFLEAIAYYGIAAARNWNITVSMVGGTINRLGTTEQKAEILPKVARGEISLAFALSEPEAGSDAAAVRTSAVLKDGCFIVNGNKMWISGALNAEYLLTVVRTDPKSERHKGLSLLLIRRDLPGVEIRPIPLLGGHALRTCEVIFDNVKVPADRLVSELHSGWLNLMPLLTKERPALAAMCVGAAQAVVDDAVRYAKERSQFGRPISKFQAIQHKLVDMQVKVDAARLLTYQAGYLLSQGQSAERECSEAKIFASDAYVQIAIEGIQVLGAYGYSMEFDMQRHFRESKLFQIFGGTGEIQRMVVARQLNL